MYIKLKHIKHFSKVNLPFVSFATEFIFSCDFPDNGGFVDEAGFWLDVLFWSFPVVGNRRLSSSENNPAKSESSLAVKEKKKSY